MSISSIIMLIMILSFSIYMLISVVDIFIVDIPEKYKVTISLIASVICYLAGRI